ncbi:MAG: DUF2490 domain-containing protein [Candidatus Gorgyraea atricola]|nr:DUF2490 domain-containing protein [Candidatus Gorgyraea atricola]
MKLVKFWLLFTAAFFCCASLVHASDDTEYWSMHTFSAKINERVKLNLLEEFRMKSDMGNFYTYVQYVGASYKVSDYFDVAGWYKLVSSKANQNWTETHRYDIDGTLKIDLDGFKLSNRSRFERNTNASSWLYRDRIKVTKKVKLFDRDYTPFLSNEFFLDIEPNDGYHENRASGGISTDFIWGTKLTLYYMSLAKKSSGEWNSANVIGTTVGVSF